MVDFADFANLGIMMLGVFVVSCVSTMTEQCAERDGVFFSHDAFPGTPGKFANERSTADELAQHVSAWTTEYKPTGALTPEQHRQFFEDGFVIVPDLVPHATLNHAITSIEALVDNLAKKLHAAGKIMELHQGAGFHERLTLLEEQFPHANVLLHKNGVLPDGIQEVWGHPALMSVAQQLLGHDADIAGHPVWNLRCKTPERLSGGQATVPWHQDNAYLDEESWATLQVGWPGGRVGAGGLEDGLGGEGSAARR